MDGKETLAAKAMELAGAVDENFLELARALRELQDADPDEFTRIVNNSGLGKRKAYYLVGIDRTFSKIPVPKLRLKKIVWTKLNVLTRAITKSNYAELLKAAEQYTAKELEKYIAGQTPEEKKRAFLAYLSPEDHEELRMAFVRVGGIRYQRGFSNKAAALAAVCRTVNALPQDVWDKFGVKAKDELD